MACHSCSFDIRIMGRQERYLPSLVLSRCLHAIVCLRSGKGSLRKRNFASGLFASSSASTCLGSFPSSSSPLHCPSFSWHFYRLSRPYVHRHLLSHERLGIQWQTVLIGKAHMYSWALLVSDQTQQASYAGIIWGIEGAHFCTHVPVPSSLFESAETYTLTLHSLRTFISLRVCWLQDDPQRLWT